MTQAKKVYAEVDDYGADYISCADRSQTASPASSHIAVTKFNGIVRYGAYDGFDFHQENTMTRWLTLFMAAASMVLAGCASPRISSEVTAFHEWPADLQGPTFTFERTKAQDESLEYRAYENLVRNELHRLGFVDATTSQPPKVKVTINYAISERDVRVVEPVVADPYWYGPPYFGPRWRGYYGPYWSPFYDPLWYGPPVTEYRDTSYQLFRRQLKIMMYRVADGKRIYDVTVNSEGRNGSLAAVMPYMVRSAFADFPGKSGVPHRVELEIKG